MHDADAVSTPIIVHSTSSDDTACHDPYLYKSLAGALQYLTFTKPDLTFSVNHLCQYMHVPTNAHF